MPEAAWKNFEDFSARGKLSQEEMVELISNKLLKDRKFLGWRKGTNSASNNIHKQDIIKENSDKNITPSKQ